MPRGLDAATKSALASDGFSLAMLVEFGFSTPIRVTDWHYALSYDGNSYTSSGNLLSIDDVKETSELRVNEMTIVLSGADQTYIAQFLNNNYIAIPVSIVFMLVDAEKYINAFTGQITGFSAEEDNGESEIKVNIASHWKDFEKAEGRHTNEGSQNRFFPSDDGFQFTDDADRDIAWGRR